MNAVAWKDGIAAVFDLHSEQRIYQPCGHDHNYEADETVAVLDVDDVGAVCEDGYRYSICDECCTDGAGQQTETCAEHHRHDKRDTVFCRTGQVVCAAMGLPYSGGAR